MADIRVYSGGAPKEALKVLTPEFEQRTGHRVHYTYAVISEMQKKLAAGETPDMVFMPAARSTRWSRPARCGRSRAASSAVSASASSCGKARRIPTSRRRSAFAMRSQRALGRACQSGATPSGAHLAKVTQQLGIDAALKDKRPSATRSTAAWSKITAGEAEIGIYPVSEVIAVPGIALVGLLPPALQSLIVYEAAVLAANAAPEPAGAFIAFLTIPPIVRSGTRRASSRRNSYVSGRVSAAPPILSAIRSCAGWCRDG